MGKIGNKIKEAWYGPHKSFIRYATYATAAFLVFSRRLRYRNIGMR